MPATVQAITNSAPSRRSPIPTSFNKVFEWGKVKFSVENFTGNFLQKVPPTTKRKLTFQTGTEKSYDRENKK